MAHLTPDNKVNLAGRHYDNKALARLIPELQELHNQMKEAEGKKAVLLRSRRSETVYLVKDITSRTDTCIVGTGVPLIAHNGALVETRQVIRNRFYLVNWKVI